MSYETKSEAICQVLASRGYSLKVFGGRFVESFGEERWPHVKSQVEVSKDGEVIISSDFKQGIACLSRNLKGKCLNGKISTIESNEWHKPKVDTVLFCFLMDGEAFFNAMSFEDFCSCYGYENNSIKDASIYKNCFETGRNLKNKLGTEEIDFLKDLFEDY